MNNEQQVTHFADDATLRYIAKLESDLKLYRSVSVFRESGVFKLGDRVRKKSGSRWQGLVVGYYSTELTPEGYAVESETEIGSVQIYPVKALEKL
jgi:dihydrofolate reductase (trimethoprim resistance protein)